MAQQVKDPALSVLWHEFDPWPGNFRMPQAQPEKKKKKMKTKTDVFTSYTQKLCVLYYWAKKIFADMQLKFSR